MHRSDRTKDQHFRRVTDEITGTFCKATDNKRPIWWDFATKLNQFELRFQISCTIACRNSKIRWSFYEKITKKAGKSDKAIQIWKSILCPHTFRRTAFGFFFIIEDFIISGWILTDFFRMVYLFGSGRNSALCNHYKSFRRVMFAIFCDSWDSFAHCAHQWYLFYRSPKTRNRNTIRRSKRSSIGSPRSKYNILISDCKPESTNVQTNGGERSGCEGLNRVGNTR